MSARVCEQWKNGVKALPMSVSMHGEYKEEKHLRFWQHISYSLSLSLSLFISLTHTDTHIYSHSWTMLGVNCAKSTVGGKTEIHTLLFIVGFLLHISMQLGLHTQTHTL